MPGGSINYEESLLTAIKREIYEEVGIILKDKVTLFSVYLNKRKGLSDYIILYIILTQKEKTKTNDKEEILEIKWFSIKEIPEDISPGTRARLEEYYQKSKISELW